MEIMNKLELGLLPRCPRNQPPVPEHQHIGGDMPKEKGSGDCRVEGGQGDRLSGLLKQFCLSVALRDAASSSGHVLGWKEHGLCKQI